MFLWLNISHLLLICKITLKRKGQVYILKDNPSKSIQAIQPRTLLALPKYGTPTLNYNPPLLIQHLSVHRWKLHNPHTLLVRPLIPPPAFGHPNYTTDPGSLCSRCQPSLPLPPPRAFQSHHLKTFINYLLALQEQSKILSNHQFFLSSISWVPSSFRDMYWSICLHHKIWLYRFTYWCLNPVEVP